MKKPDKKIEKFLNKNWLMTLATSLNNESWCCSLFYIYNNEDVSLYVTTDENSKHGIFMQKNPIVSGVIAPQTSIIRKIRGIQFYGLIELLEGDEKLYARRKFCIRFPVANFFDLKMWKVKIAILKYTDNTLGFGTKILWIRENDV